MATSTTSSPDGADNTVKLGPIERARTSVAALRLLTILEEERRTATEEERRVLSGWSGWGPLAKALEEKREGTWDEIGQELRELLTPSQVRSGLEACTNSFYTPPEITRACWDILTGLGFDGGRVLEPGCGSGRFIASTPDSVDAEWLGVESDQVSAAIARHLHPQAMIMATPMEKANLPGNCADAVVGNVPFENVRVYDPSAPDAVTNTLHDYMIWSSVQALSPGGIAVLVTSCGTLDKIDGAARRALDAEAALVGAIRLPGGAFGSSGTEVATDILILRRRLGEEPQRNFSGPAPRPENLPEDPLLAATARGDWTDTGKAMNRWLEAFPETVLGTVGRHEYRTGQVTVTADESTPWPQALEAAVATTVERATAAGLNNQVLPAPVSLAEALAPAPDGLKEGRILTVEREVTKDDKTRTLPVIAQVVEGRVEEVRTNPPKPKEGEEPEQGNLKVATKELFALIELRDAALELFEADADLDHVSDADLAPIRERVLDLYEAYHDTYGPIGRAKVSYSTKVDEETEVEELIETRRAVDLGGMRDDVDLATLLALENYDLGSNTATPADILYRRINAPSEAATYADTPHEAVAISLNITNRVDHDHIATLLGIPVDQVEGTLISAHAAFRDPANPGGDLVPAPVYLSGAIGLKLETARKAAEDDDTYTANVQALEGARPEPLPPEKIEARLGAPWIPASVIEDFAREVLEIRTQVSAYRSTGDWAVTVSDQAKDPRRSVANCEQWAYTPPPPKKGDPELYLTGYGPLSGEGLTNRGPLRRGDELLQSALNNKSPEIRYYVTDDKTARHDKFSRDADKVQERLQRTFSTWVWQDPNRARLVADAFNRDFQSTVPPNPSGEHLTFPGMSAVIEPYSHQLEFVSMALGRKAAACIHDMGGGKTATMFMTAIKHVQLGLATNPIIVVPNGLLDDITRAGKQLFPGARILMATDRDMRNEEARRRFARKCAANRWDAIVMTESMYSRIPVHPKTEAEFHEWYKADLAATYSADVKDAQGAQAKKVAKKIKARSARAKELLSQRGADKNTTYFGHLGSNMVLYDEASDWMRNLGEWVQVEGIPMSKPKKAAQGFLKAMTVQMHGGKAFLFTGTPMVRNMVDLYSIMLTVDREGLVARGIYNAEQFARTFIRMETVLEPTADGQGVKLRRRVREPLNEEQLRALFGEGAHVRMNLQLDLPELVQHVHTVEATPSLRAYASELAHRESQIKGWRQAKGADTYFSLVALGRAAALDPALIGLPEEGRTKLDEMADTIGQRYHQTKELRFADDPAGVQGGLQLAFVNQGVPHGKDARTYGRLRDKLVAQGVPAKRIAFVHDHDKPDQRARLYEGCRAGKYSVLIGSFAKMGYGVNVQDRLSDIHIADVGWNPADLRQAIKRGYRAGNLNPQVNVHLYPVTHSVDARFFALNEQRRVVEEAFLSGGNGAETGTMGEIAASDLGSLSAIAADNPRLMELQNLKQTLEDLEDSASMHESNLARTSANINERTRRIELLRSQVSELTPLAEIVQATPERTIRAAGESQYPLEEDTVHERLNQLMRQTIEAKRTFGIRPSITYRGLSMTMSWNPPEQDQQPYVTAQIGHRDHPDSVHQVQMKEAWTRKGQTWRLTRAVTQAIDALPDHVEGLSGQISDLSESNDRARQMLDAPFEDAAALDSLRAEVGVLEEELARESNDLAERAAKVEALALTEITTVLSDTAGQGEARIGYDRHGQMAVDVDVDQVRLARPPLGWTETAAPGATRTGRAVHGVHWQLTHHDSPVPSPLPFTAHIASTLEGLVRARVDIVHQHGATRGVETTALDGDYPTYADALIAVRDYLSVEIRDTAKTNLPRQVRFALTGQDFDLHEPVRPLERSWWDTDIERLSRTTPGTLLRTGMDEAGQSMPARTHHTVDKTLRDFNGRFVLIRLTTGPTHAIDLVVDEAGNARLGGETRLESELIAEVLDLQRSLLPGAASHYVAPGQEAMLSADLLWATTTHPGDPLDTGSRSLNRHLQGTSGLNAVGKKIECTIDRTTLGSQATDTDRNVTVHGRLAEVDDATLTVHLDLDVLVGGTPHERPLNDTDALGRLDPRPSDKFKRDPNDPEQRRQIPVFAPFPLRIPLAAVTSMGAAGRTWERAAAEAVRAKVEERQARTEQAAEPAPEPQPPPEMTPQRLAKHVRDLAEDLAGHHEVTDAALAKALTLLEGEHPDPLVAVRHSLAAGLTAAADAASEHSSLGTVVDHVADGLSAAGEPAPAVRLRQLYLERAPDAKKWTQQILADAHTWASTRLEATEDVPAAAANLLHQGVETWPRTGAGFDAAATALDTLLDAGLYAHAHRMRAALREAFPGRSDDWRLKALMGRFDAMTTAAAHIDATGPADNAPVPRQVPFPHGLGVLWGRNVIVLDSEGQTHPSRVLAVNSNYALAADDGHVWGQHQIAQVRTTDNQVMALAHGEPTDLDDALAAWGEQRRSERTAYLQTFHDALTPWVGAHVQVLGSRSVLAEGALEEVTPVGVRLSTASGAATVAFEDIGAVDPDGGHRWWSDADHNRVEQHLAAADHALAGADHPLARRHLAAATDAQLQLTDVPTVHTERWNTDHDRLSERAHNPAVDGEPFIQIERSGPQGRTVRIYGTQGRTTVVQAALGGLMASEPALTWSEEERAFTADPRWQPVMIDARLEQLRQGLGAAGMVHATALVDHPEPGLPLLPVGTATPSLMTSVPQEPEIGQHMEEPRRIRSRQEPAPFTEEKPRPESAGEPEGLFAPAAEGSGDTPQPPTPTPVPAPPPERAAQESTGPNGLPEHVDHLVRAVVYRIDDAKIYVPVDAPREWREAITRNGWRFDDDHAPWADSGPSRGDLRQLREELTTLADPPTIIEAGAWHKRIREALGAKTSDKREYELHGVGQHQAHAEISRLIRDRDVRAAYGVMADHVTALRRAGLLPDRWVIDPEQGLSDPYTIPASASRSNAEYLERQVVWKKDTWSAQEVADLAEQLHRQCPHLNAEQVAEILPAPTPAPNENLHPAQTDQEHVQGEPSSVTSESDPTHHQELAEQARSLLKPVVRDDEGLQTQVSHASTLLASQLDEEIVEGYFTLGDLLARVAEMDVDHGPLLDLTQEVASTLSDMQEFDRAILVRQSYLAHLDPPKRGVWKDASQADARQWAVTAPAPETELPQKANELLDTHPQEWPNTVEWFDDTVRDLLGERHYQAASQIMEKADRAPRHPSQTYEWELLKSDYTEVVTGAAYTHAARRDWPGLGPFPLSIHGMPSLYRNQVAILFPDRSTQVGRVEEVPSIYGGVGVSTFLVGDVHVNLRFSLQIRTTDNQLMFLSEGTPADMEPFMSGLRDELTHTPEADVPTTPEPVRAPTTGFSTAATPPASEDMEQEPEPTNNQAIEESPVPDEHPSREKEATNTAFSQGEGSEEVSRFHDATRALEELGAGSPSSERRDELNAALQGLLDYAQHTDVQRLAQEADQVDPAGRWERADLLSIARFAQDPEGLAAAIRLDYNGSKTTVIRLTGDDSERPVRELLKDKSGPYKAIYDGKSRDWEIKRRRPSVEDYRELLSDLVEDLADLGHTWVTEKAHNQLAERHRAQTEAALTAAGTVAAVNSDGHVGELADVLTYPALRVSAVIRHKDNQGEPADSWTVVYDTGQGAELTERTNNEPDVRRGQTLTDVQVKIHDHAFSAQGDARTIIIRIPPQGKRSFPLTAEQEQIQASALAGRKAVVQAGAGTGKTATMGVVAETLAEQGRKGVYVVYGRANADEAALKLAHVPIATNTIHAFARRAVGGPYNERINGDRQPNWRRTADDLGLGSVVLPSGHPMDGEDLARLLDRTIQAFELSADLDLTTSRIPRLPGLSEQDHSHVQRLLEPLLDRAWVDMCNPGGTLFRFRHDTYVKIWQLTPGGPKMHIGGQGQPYLLIDEAQDMNPVAEAILQAQTHMQQIWVGDSAQAIHGWRGAKDALVNQNPDVEHNLSQSFRFGEAVATEANRWLDAIDAPLRVKGTPNLDTIVHDRMVENPDAVLARTNAGAFNAALDQLQRGRRVAIVGGTDDLTKLVDAADKLREGKRTTHPDLSHFRSWGGVVKVVNERPEDLGSLAPFVRLVDKLGTDKVREALSQMTDTDPEVEVCTAHKSKGLEWDRVQIADDFAPKEEHPWSPEEFKAEAQLAYVATTRARKELGRGSLSYIDTYLDSSDPSSTEHLQQQDEDLTPAEPAAEQDSVPQVEGKAEPPETPVQDRATEATPSPSGPEQPEPSTPQTPSSNEVSPAPQDDYIVSIPLQGELEETEYIRQAREAARALPEELRQALLQPRNAPMGQGHGPGVDWSQTPVEHLDALQERGMAMTTATGERYLTQYGYNVSRLLNRMLHGPDTDLMNPSANQEIVVDTTQEPEQQPTEGDQAPQAEPTPQPGTPTQAGEDPQVVADQLTRNLQRALTQNLDEHGHLRMAHRAEGTRRTVIDQGLVHFDATSDVYTLTPWGERVREALRERPAAGQDLSGGPVQNQPSESQRKPAHDPDIHRFLETLDNWGGKVEDGRWVYTLGSGESLTAEEIRERFLTSQQEEIGPDPQAEVGPAEPDAFVESERTIYDELADMEELTPEEEAALEAPAAPSTDEHAAPHEEAPTTEAPAPTVPPEQNQPPGAESTADPERQTSGPAEVDPELNSEANRARAARGKGPLRRGKLTLELPDDPQEQQRRQATIEVGTATATAAAVNRPPAPTAPEHSEGPEPRQGQVSTTDPGAHQQTGEGPTRIDGRQIRAEDNQWQKIWEKQGRAEARRLTDPVVYDKMRTQFRQALASDRDVHLVMPSNDPAMVKEFINIAREHGYEITLKAAIPPNPMWALGVAEQLHNQIQQGTPERAMSLPECRAEYTNLRQILRDVHSEHLVDRLELYPREGVTTDTTPVIRDHLIGTPDNPQWSLNTPIEKHINALDSAQVTDPEDGRLRTRVAEMVEQLPSINEVPEHQRWAHQQVNEVLNFIERTNNERQPYKDTARRTTMNIGGQEQDESPHADHPQAPHREEPSQPEEPHPHEAEHEEVREPAMAGGPTPSREEALNASHTPRPGQGVRRPPPSPKHEYGAPTHQTGATPRARQGPRP